MRLLAIHPNFELYGSDRSFAAAIAALEQGIPGIEVTCVLPQEGPILTLPVFKRIRTLFESMWIPRRGDLKVVNVPWFIARGAAHIAHSLRAMRRYDITYIDTIITLDYIAATMLTSRKSIVHVREIPTGREMAVFRRMLLLSNSYLIFNSKATQEAFKLPPSKIAKSFVVYNGTEVPPRCDKDPLDGKREVRVLVIGRLNAWKGQEVLVAAIATLTADQRAKLDVRIVGSVFGDMDHFRQRLVDAIEATGLGATITMKPFMDDPTGEYAWADVVVVPSTKPEPFGRVAIEAMSHGAAVIATAHGGPTEIVVDGETGRLVPPSDAASMAVALGTYVADPRLLREHGDAGYRRFLALFTNEASDNAIVKALQSVASY